ncbi:MAG: class I SAM-dependent RNA methyltransferase, partial [Bdellovibrionales bacterium]
MSGFFLNGMAKNNKSKTAAEKSQPFFIGDKVRVRIERLAYHSGHGVARHNGFVVFVPWTAPDDDVEVLIEKMHSSYAEARLLRIITPSPHRREPLCPVAGRCGGCQWQHVRYEEQLVQKQQMLKSALRKLAHEGALPLKPLVPSPAEFRYRNRIQLHRHGFELGYYAAGSRQLVPIEDCWLAEEALVQQFAKAKSRNADGPQERIEIARLKSGQVELRQSAAEAEAALFSQVNEAQNQNLIQMVLEAAGSGPYTQILDLYCGSGNLTFPLAKAFPDAQVTGVELSRIMVESARAESALLPRQSALEWVAAPTSQFLEKYRPSSPNWLLVLDPPRPGCDTATRMAILRLRPR